MNIKTAYMGEVEILEDEVLTFEHGLPGFEDEKKFVILEIGGNKNFKVLQSIMTEKLAFIVTNPYNLLDNYSFDLEESIVYSLQITDEQEVAVLAIVSLKESLASSTVNLKAPIIININKNIAKQVILNNEDYPIRYVISHGSKEV